MRELLGHAGTCGLAALALGANALIPAASFAQEQKIGAPPEAKNMRLVGYNDLQARSAYQPTIHRQGDRYIAYIGHHGGSAGMPKPVNPLTGQPEFNGTSIVDVTDPATAEISVSHSRRWKARTRRAARRWRASATAGPWARAIPMRSICSALSARRRKKSGTSPIRPSRKAVAPGWTEGYAQELLGMRHRHRLSGVRRPDGAPRA